MQAYRKEMMEMSGIVVGVDGSAHSRKALDWAAREAGIRHVPLTVLTVHQAVAGYFTHSVVDYPGDKTIIEKNREAAQRETDEVLRSLGDGPRPESVTVTSRNGFPTEEILNAAQAAEVLEVTPDRIAVLVEEGLLTPLEGHDEPAFDAVEVRAVNQLGG